MIFESTFPLLEKVEQNRLKSGAKPTFGKSGAKPTFGKSGAKSTFGKVEQNPLLGKWSKTVLDLV
jgi:hypothetical protein